MTRKCGRPAAVPRRETRGSADATGSLHLSDRIYDLRGFRQEAVRHEAKHGREISALGQESPRARHDFRGLPKNCLYAMRCRLRDDFARELLNDLLELTVIAPRALAVRAMIDLDDGIGEGERDGQNGTFGALDGSQRTARSIAVFLHLELQPVRVAPLHPSPLGVRLVEPDPTTVLTFARQDRFKLSPKQRSSTAGAIHGPSSLYSSRTPECTPSWGSASTGAEQREAPLLGRSARGQRQHGRRESIALVSAATALRTRRWLT